MADHEAADRSSGNPMAPPLRLPVLLLLAVLVLSATPVGAAGPASDAGQRAGQKDEQGGGHGGEQGDKTTGERTEGADDEVDTENLFGFTEGAEAGKRGEQEVLTDTTIRAGKRRAGPGRSGFSAANTRLTYQYDPADGFSIETSVFADLRRVRAVEGLPDKDYGTFDGASLELKYQFLHGSNAQPLGLALEIRPSYRRVLATEGRGADLFDMESVIEADVRLVPDRLWYGTNLSIDPSDGRLRGRGAAERSSLLLWSHALAARVAEDTFVGPELRYSRTYDGLFLNRFRGRALTLGPTLYRTLPRGAYLILAYAAQIAGHDRELADPRRAFDLRHYERHAVRVKFGVEF
ncbi:hypothetical protein [Methylobacterium sp. Leaf118]|uniref:hypothetical protein n=1 Tax=Methylobacterium sp. Leaf118 TaxID=2876562 RepID=UPI001E5A835F|nr:hypothetical protein [Methylobacterium sp. Leaf118]